MTDHAPPYLSIVVTTRNDDHGGDPLKRLQAFVNCVDEQAGRTSLDAEVIVVEWNPCPGRPKVSSLLQLPQPSRCTYRFVEVPPELHNSFRHADVLPLFQMIAKNVGIRRARGRFVLATNIDIIFSTELIEYLAAQRLQPGSLYRVDRHDIQADFPIEGPLDRKLTYASSHQLRVHTRDGSHPVDPDGRPIALADDVVDGRAVQLGAGWHVREGSGETAYRWASDHAQLIIDAAAAQAGDAAVVELEVEANPYDPRAWARVEVLGGERPISRFHITGRTRLEIPLGTPNDHGRHVIDLRVTEAYANHRSHLPVFERRDSMYYRLHLARLRAAGPSAAFEYPASGWSNANTESAQTVETTDEGLRIVSDRQQSSYCVHYGPLRAPATGSYRFDVGCSVLEGRVLAGVLSGDRHRWLPATVISRQDSYAPGFDITVKLQRNELFWLMIFNDHPDGDVPSRFIVQKLIGSVSHASVVPTRTSGLRTNPVFERYSRLFTRLAIGVRRVMHVVASRERWHDRAARWADRAARLVHVALGERMRGRVVRLAPEYRSVERMLRASDEQLRATAPLHDLAAFHRFLRDRRPDNLHVNGCGDFQLMAREHWEALRGYPELETFSMNIDGLFSYIADAAGIKEQLLTMPIYHLEHEVGSGWSPEGEALLRRRIAERGITWVDSSTVYIWAAYMRWLQRPMIVNGPDWGLAGAHLEEPVVTAHCRAGS